MKIIPYDMKSNAPKLTVILGTYNRLILLKKCLASILDKIKSSHEIIVVDANSTDGTIEYLNGMRGKIKLIKDQKIGQAKSINKLFKKIQSQYVCWLSDDNILKKGMLDVAVSILDKNKDVGMVALKVKDVTGPYTREAYIGGISPAGILNVNQGVLRLNLMKQVGYFDEEYSDYGMDVDLTTKILLKGYKIVYTKDIAIFHYRDYKNYPGAFLQRERNIRLRRSQQVYESKYRSLCIRYRREKLFFFRFVLFFRQMYLWSNELVFFPLFFLLGRTRYSWLIGEIRNRGLYIKKFIVPIPRDWNNILRGQYISLLDLWYNRKNDYYLVQKIKK